MQHLDILVSFTLNIELQVIGTNLKYCKFITFHLGTFVMQ